MKGKMILIKAEYRNIEECTIIEVKDENEDFIDIIKESIGGWMEVVHPRNLKHPYIMVVDEEGLIKSKQLNLIGTKLYNYKNINAGPIVGDVILTKIIYTDEGPDLGLLDDEDVSNVLSNLKHLLYHIHS